MSEGTFILATGRRKSAIARVKISQDKGNFIVNGRDLKEYFPEEIKRKNILKPLQVTGLEGKVSVSAKIVGGGKVGQVGALIHGIARALLKQDEKLKEVLRKEGFLTRDPRTKERRKYGLRGARKAKQYTKR